MLKFLLNLLGIGPGPDPIQGAMTGVRLKPFDNNREEPYWTLSRALEKELKARGVVFDASAEFQCLLDWEKLGGSHMRLKLAAKIDQILVEVAVREGFPFLTEVDFDIEDTIEMDEEKKTIMFLRRGAQKLAERLEYRYLHDLR